MALKRAGVIGNVNRDTIVGADARWHSLEGSSTMHSPIVQMNEDEAAVLHGGFSSQDSLRTKRFGLSFRWLTLFNAQKMRKPESATAALQFGH